MSWQTSQIVFCSIYLDISHLSEGRCRADSEIAKITRVFSSHIQKSPKQFCQYIPWSTDFFTFHFQVMMFFYEICIMHNWLPDYHIVALAICETSNPAVLWKLNLQTRMICTAALNPHQRAQWLNEMLDPGQVCSGAPSLLEERERTVQRFCTGIAAHTGKTQGVGGSMPLPVELMLSSKMLPLHWRL